MIMNISRLIHVPFPHKIDMLCGSQSVSYLVSAENSRNSCLHSSPLQKQDSVISSLLHRCQCYIPIKIIKDHQIILSLLRQESGSILAHACSMTQTSSRHPISGHFSIVLGWCLCKISTGQKVSPSGDRPVIFMYDASRQPQHQSYIVFIFDFQCSFASGQQ